MKKEDLQPCMVNAGEGPSACRGSDAGGKGE